MTRSDSANGLSAVYTFAWGVIKCVCVHTVSSCWRLSTCCQSAADTEAPCHRHEPWPQCHKAMYIMIYPNFVVPYFVRHYYRHHVHILACATSRIFTIKNVARHIVKDIPWYPNTPTPTPRQQPTYIIPATGKQELFLCSSLVLLRPKWCIS